VDLDLTAEEASFYEEAYSWLSAHVPAGSHAPPSDADAARRSREWDRALFDAGWSVLNWPRRYGGRDASLFQWLLFEDAYHAVDAPYRLSHNGVSLLAPTVMEFGTEEQKDEILLPLAQGEVVWAQAWSEPGSGSDLASLTSRAEEIPGGFRVNGRKIWSSNAPYADRAFGLFRSGEQSERHRGLTYLMLALDSPGVTVSPIRRVDGRANFAEILFEDVFVPRDGLLGEVGRGWDVAMATTGSERGFALRSPGRFTGAAERVLELLDEETRGRHPDLVDRAVQAWQDAQAFRLRVLTLAARVGRGESVGAESSVDKVFWSELDVRIAELAMDVIAVRGPEVADAQLERWIEAYVTALPGTIYGGTNEIQRNIIAQRQLALPRSY